MNSNFNQALNHALDQEFAWLEDFKNPYVDYEFSDSFQKNMEGIIDKAEYTYVSVGHRRIRKSLLAILIALFVLAATGCAVVTKYLIEWHETQNDKHGTLDVTFDISGDTPASELIPITPDVPDEFEITSTYQDALTYTLEYCNDTGEYLMYSQDSNIENMGLSIDNEDADFRETTINGYKGYSYFRDGISALFWADGVNFYTLQGTCDMEVLEDMAKSIRSE